MLNFPKKSLLPLLAFVMLFAGCSSFGGPRVDSLSDSIAATSASIESLAQETRQLCGNTQPGGECLAGALIDTETKNDIREMLQNALDSVKVANTALNARDEASAASNLDQAQAVLSIIRAEIARRQ